MIFLVMLLVSAFVSDAFFTANNLSNLVRQVTPVGIISMGMLLVIIAVQMFFEGLQKFLAIQGLAG